MKFKALALGALSMVAASAVAGTASARDTIQIVGSSTVFPFATAVAEQFGKTTKFGTPVIESTGSGGGMKLFCTGAGVDTPDITNASRRMKTSEFETCQKNGITEITEVKVGFDGIVFATAIDGPTYELTLKDLFMALAKDVPADELGLEMQANPYKMWNEIREDLPAVEIAFIGPPPSSGTRDALQEIAVEGGCKKFEAIKALKKEDSKAYKKICRTIREDGVYEEAGENDNLIVNKLQDRPTVIGIMGFSFLDQNSDKIKGSIVEGNEPTFENIAAGAYPVSRSLFFYIKKAHVEVVPGIKEYVAEWTKESTWGPDGYLADKGLIPLPDETRAAMSEQANGLGNLTLEMLESGH